MFKFLKALDRLKKLEEDSAELHRRFRALSLDMDDLFDRMKRLTGRIVKRQAIDDNASIVPSSGVEESSETAAVPSSPFPHLTPRQLQIQNSLLARRKLNGGQR